MDDGELAEIATETRRAMARLSQRLRAERSPDSLSLNKLVVLSHLYRGGPSTPGEITLAAWQRPQSLTRVFAELAREGLITRRPSERDGRESVLDLTEAGRAALVADAGQRDAWLTAALAELTETEARMVRLAAGLLDRLADADPGEHD
ncbi:MarR family winged helix-turn-helix transcriptional regulator [Kutzneria sp. CA-103260]|uniref:MarR family winged helix-turn-helix transcriptional regulator n=1 Tax=Kutzneria sp. CA-103260 TaxID=2802641 RepID=UPI001BEFAEB1|nr:MarR family transcriptional regulator [Kutzneria sp. CA-103260]QUQ66155.1 MarR family transcriptional regulator [Kutzneria sp. CA-103260]